MRTEVAMLSVLIITVVAGLPPAGHGQTGSPVFVDQIAWVDPRDWLPANVTLGTFQSTSMDVGVGYPIYLPPGYEEDFR
jgi:hypothetical protein